MGNLGDALTEANAVLSAAVNRYLGDGLTDAVMLVPAGNANRRTGDIMTGGTPDNIVIHETANTNPGADAIMHGHFLIGGGGADRVGFHAGVDHKRTIQYLPWNERCRAAGDGAGPGNNDSVNIELCVNRDGDFWAAVRRLAVLVARLMRKFGIPLARVRQHNYYSSYKKNCPYNLRLPGSGNWARFLTMVQTEYDKLINGGSQVTQDRLFPETGIKLDAAFVAYFDANGGIPVFGYPIRPAKITTSATGAPIKIQYTERARLELHPDNSIKRGLIGAELVAELGI